MFLKFKYLRNNRIFLFHIGEKTDSCIHQVCMWNNRTYFHASIDEKKPIRVFIKYVCEITEQIFDYN